jgi:hypothetical protein
MKKVLVGLLVAAAAVFTACGDDDSSSAPESTYSCNVDLDLGVLGNIHICAESFDQAKIEGACGKANEMAKSLESIENAGTLGSVCPGGAKKVCEGKLSGVPYTAYFYEEDSAEESCDDLLAGVDGFGF